MGRIFIPVILLLLILPSSATGRDNPFPKFDALTKDGYSLEPGDMRVGRVKLHPGLAFESRYESNIFEEADRDFQTKTEDPTDDFIFTIKPSMGIALDRAPGEVFGFFVDYEGRDESYLEEGGTQNFFNHEVGGGVNLGGPGGRSDLTIGGSWEKRAGGGSRDFNSNIGNRQVRRTYTGYADLIYSISKIFKLELNVSVEDNKYQARRAQNVDEYNAGGALFWQATTPAAFGIKYNHKIREYELPTPSNDNSQADQVFLALRWEPSSLFFGEFAVGYDTKRYKNIKGDNSENLVYQVDLRYRPVKRTKITFKAGRQIVDSTFSTIQSYVLSSARLKASQRLGKKMSAFIDLIHEHLDYRRSAPDSANGGGIRTRIDNTVSGATGLKYDIQKWLEATAKYKYEENISNFDDRDFINHIGLFEIAAKY